MKPRFIWRRIFAAIIDYLIVAFLTSLVMMVLAVFVGPEKLRMSMGGISSATCYNGDTISPEMAEFLGQDTVVAATYCQGKTFFFNNGYTAQIVLSQERDGNITRSRKATVAIDEQGRPVSPVHFDAFIALAIAYLTAIWWMTRTGGKTWGKAVLGLRVTPADPARLRKREALRLAPLATLAVLGLVLGAITPLLNLPELAQISTSYLLISGIGTGLLVTLFLGWAYVLPLLRGERRARYDIAAGTHVLRA